MERLVELAGLKCLVSLIVVELGVDEIHPLAGLPAGFEPCLGGAATPDESRGRNYPQE